MEYEPWHKNFQISAFELIVFALGIPPTGRRVMIITSITSLHLLHILIIPTTTLQQAYKKLTSLRHFVAKRVEVL